MALPKLDTPLFKITLPVSQNKITFRPFLVKEEKILMMAKEGGSESMLLGLKQILEAVIMSPSNLIELDGKISIELKEPTLAMMEKLNVAESELSDTANVYKLLYACTDKVFDAEEVYDDFSEEEFDTFIKSMDITMFSKLKDFFDTGPKLVHELKYVNKEGNDRVIKLEGISDFF